MDYNTFISKVATFKSNESITCLAFDEESISTSSSLCSCCERSENEGKCPASKYDPMTGTSSTSYTICENCLFYFKNGRLESSHLSAIE